MEDFEFYNSMQRIENKYVNMDEEIRRDELNSKIDKMLERNSDSDIRNVLLYIKQMPDISHIDLVEKEWFFNNGNFRTRFELDEHEKQKVYDQYVSSGQYRRDMESNCGIHPFRPFLINLTVAIISGCIGYNFTSSDIGYFCTYVFFFSIPAMVVTLWVALPLMAKQEKIKQQRAEYHNVPKTDWNYKKSKIKEYSAIAASIESLYKSGKSFYKNGKDFMNPDTWPQSK